jgi:hypothetical protein
MKLSNLRMILELDEPPTDVRKIEHFKSSNPAFEIHHNTLVKFLKSTEKELYRVPGYCIKWGEVVKHKYFLGSVNSLYKVHFNTAKLKPIPFLGVGIVGWGGHGPKKKLSQDEIDQLVLKHNHAVFLGKESEAVFLGKESEDDEIPVGLMHDAIRSIEPGVYNPGEDGMITEVIINVPCKMTLLKLSHELDQIELDLG